MKLSASLLILVVGLTGCTNPLMPSKRHNGYDDSAPPLEYTPTEPYASFSGYSSNGSKLYLIHWTGNPLNLTGHLESEIDAMNIPKYNS